MELMILTHDDDVCMYVCMYVPSFFNRQDCTMETGMYVSPSAPPELVTMHWHDWDGIQCPLLHVLTLRMFHLRFVHLRTLHV